MKNQIENECEEIGDNFDDIEIKKLNYYRPPDSIITSNNSSISQSTILFNNERSSQNQISNKPSDIFVGKQDIRNREEESKNIENDNYKNMKEKTISNLNSYINMNKENNGLISNKMSYKNSDKNNIKDMLYQNRNIINNMHNIINSSTNESKTKFESSYLNNSSKSLENNSYYPNTFSTDRNNNLTKGDNEKEKDIDEYKSKGKTFYNYNENYQTKMGGEDSYLENKETFNNDLNGKIIANSKEKNTSYQTNNNNSSTNVSNANTNVYVEKYKFVQSDIDYKDYNQQTAKFNIEGNDKQEEKKEEYKPIIKASIPNSTTKATINNNVNMNIMSSKLINTKDYFFNYRTQDAFDKMNQAMTQPVQEGKIYTSVNNKNITSNNNINKINITNINSTLSTTTKIGTNYNEINIKNDSSKYNNFLNSNDLKIKKEFKQYNTIEPNNIGNKENKIKIQIENEEKKLRKLEEEKGQLIKEEKETRQIFFNELTKRDNININNANININTNTNVENSKRLNIIKAYQEKTNNNQLKELLIQTRNDDNKMKPITKNPNITNSATNLNTNININLNSNMNTNMNTNNMNMNLTQNYNSYNINSNIKTISKEKSSPNLSQKYAIPNYSTNSIESEKNDNYYREFLKQIQDRNEQITKKTYDTINNNLNKNNQNYNYEKINKNEINVQKKKSLSVGHKQIEIKDYMNNYTLNYNNYETKNYLNNKTYSNISTINAKNEYNLNSVNTVNTTNSVNKKTRYESEKKYNINSYFQLKDKENDLKNKKTIFNYDLNYDNKNKYEQTLSSYNDENNKESNKVNNNPSNTRSYPMSYTPNGLYRSNKNENNLLNNNYLPKNTIDNNNNNRLIYNNNNNNQNSLNNSKNIRDEIIKTLSNNNYNSMTQTRFYRNKTLPETALSNYSNDQLNTITNLNTISDYNNKKYESYNGFKKQNSTRSFSNLNFDINKDLISNSTKYVNINTNTNSYMSNRQNSTILNNTLTTLTNNTQTNNYYNITSTNNNNNNNIDNKLNNATKYKCTLRKGKSFSNIDKFIDSDILNESKLTDFYSKNYKYNYNNTNPKLMPDYNKGYGSSTYNRRNTYRNATLNNFNKINNNSFKFNNNNANICDKCLQKYFSNRNFYNMENNGNNGNTGFANNNNMRICETCKKLGADENSFKRANYFPFA